MGGANVIDRRSVEVLTAHWSVVYSFLFTVYYFWGAWKITPHR